MLVSDASPRVLRQLSHQSAPASGYTRALRPVGARHSPIMADHRILRFYKHGLFTNVAAKTLLWLGLADFHMTLPFLSQYQSLLLGKNTTTNHIYSYARRGKDYLPSGNWKIRSLFGVLIIGPRKVLHTTSEQQGPEILLPPCPLPPNVKCIFHQRSPWAVGDPSH